MRLRVLVFDDDLVHHRDFLADVPADFVYRPHADDAVRDVLMVNPDVVLMDYSMGRHKSGARACGDLRERFPRLVIVGISSDPRMNERIMMAGADAALPKITVPGRLPALLERLER